MTVKLLLVVCMAAWLIFPSALFAAGLSVKPVKIELETSFGREVTGEVLVRNISDEPTLYEVYPDSYIKSVAVSPQEFRLDPGEAQIISLRARLWLNGKYDFDLSILSRSLNSTSLSAAAGVKLPITIHVQCVAFWFLGLFIFSLLLSPIYLFRAFKK